MFVTPNFNLVVAALCKMYGTPDVGAYELFIPIHVIKGLSPTGQIQQLPEDPSQPGVRLRYYPNRVIEGEVVETTIEPSIQT